MTEKEKMLAGVLYDANDSELYAERKRAKKLCAEFNKLNGEDDEVQREAAKKIIDTTAAGDTFCFVPPLWCDYGYNTKIGKNFFANHNTTILDCAPVTFGDNVMIGPDCGFYTAGHPLDAKTRNSGLEYAYPITVGNNVWIGGGVRVVPGVKIGNNVVIGSGSVVTKDIPDGVVAAGNPCRVIRKIEEKA